MTNRLLKTLGLALLGFSFTACGAVDDSNAAENRTAEEKDSLADVQAALSALPSARVADTHKDGLPAFIQGRLGDASPTAAGLRAADAHAGAASALQAIAPALRLNAQDLVFKRLTVDNAGNQFLHYGQTKDGIRVLGDGLVLQVDAGGQVTAAYATARDGQASSIGKKRVSAQAAELAAKRAAPVSDAVVDGSAELTYVRDQDTGKLYLTQAVRVKGTESDGMPYDATLYVDAGTGAIRDVVPNIHTALNRAVYSANNGTSLPGTLKRSEGGAATGDAHVDGNYGKLGETYNCYKNNFNRDSFNNAGAQLKSTVHYSSNYVNAYWNSSQMVYGDGNGTDSGMLGLSADVTTHELTHAVTEYESNLTYSGESGGINEAMSDIFGAYCESYISGTWATTNAVFMVGDDIWTPATPGDALRYMYDPAKDGVSKDFWVSGVGSADVHYTSGIANLAFTLLSKGGTHPRGKSTINVTGIGVQKAGAIFYKANVDLLTASSNYAALKTAAEQAATQLGYTSAEVASVTAAFQAVGVGVVTPPAPTTTLTNGVPVTGISGSTGTQLFYKLTVPASQASVTFTTSGSGDADLYVKLGSQPSTSSYDKSSTSASASETITITSPAAGDYYVLVYAYSAISGVSLTGTYTAGGGGGGTVLTNGVATAPYSGASGSMTCYTLVVPTGKTSVVFNQAGGTGDADLYVRFGSAPTTSTYNCRPYLSGNTETCTISNPSAGTWYACSRGYSAYTNTTMKGTY